METISRWWVVTDIDGTLMDHNYDFTPAVSTIKWLQRNKVPIIPCTSKTASEVRFIRENINLTDPYIVENGGAVYGNKDNSSEEWQLVLGATYRELLDILGLISAKLDYELEPLNSLTDSQINKLTGLKGDSISRARERMWSVPFLNPPLAIQDSFREFEDEFNVTILQGNRMSHLLSKGSHKGKAVLELKKFLKEPRARILALGDSPNDIPLLEIADKAVVIPGPDGPNKKVLQGMSGFDYVLPDLPNSYGWAYSVKEILGPFLSVK